MSNLLPIADSHVHFWDLEHNRYPWLEPLEPTGPFGRTAAIRNTYLLEDYRSDAVHQNVAKMVHVEAGWQPDDKLGEMRWIQALADKRGAPDAHVAHIDLAADDAADLIKQHSAFPLFRGVRDRLQDGDFTRADGANIRIDDPNWRKGLKAMDRRGLVFDLQAPTAISAKAKRLALDYPGISFVLTHAGYPPSPSDVAVFQNWCDGIREMASAQNVSIKLSGLMLGEKIWNAEHARRTTEIIVETFGVDRVMVASNFPVDRLFASLDDLFGHYRDWISDLATDAQRKILLDNTCRIYQLDD